MHVTVQQDYCHELFMAHTKKKVIYKDLNGFLHSQKKNKINNYNQL